MTSSLLLLKVFEDLISKPTDIPDLIKRLGAMLVQTSFVQSMTYEAGILEYEDFPRTEQPVWVLGSQYSALYDLDELKDDVLSRLWFTYRKGFSPIGGNGPTTDQGWGCMLRCGQMMLAQALINRHLHRDWRWRPHRYEPDYERILQMFLDKRGCCYSIHQIASMGASEGKEIGEWFGPNTIAQVLKKLSVYDDWSNLAIHVALDNTVIIDDIRTLCTQSVVKSRGSTPMDSSVDSTDSSQTEPKTNSSTSASKVCSCNKENKSSPACSSGTGLHNGLDFSCSNCGKAKKDIPKGGATVENTSWRPLLLVIPLRLGLSEINSVYINCLKTCLTFKQSVGIIGGKPNHAHWFVGCVDDELMYLDPHVTQGVVDTSLPEGTDESFHCPYICRMKIDQLDPSIAVGFYCHNEAEVEELCTAIRKTIIGRNKTPMFELHQHRPSHWPPFEPYIPKGAEGNDFTMCDRHYDTDEEFELL